MSRLIVTGTDTGIGKTVLSAMLTLALAASYFKPVQSGTVDETDRDAVKRMTGLGDDRVLPNAVTLREPLSPHRSAELDGVEIDVESLAPPPSGPLIVEGAGGLMVPLNRKTLFIDLFARWQLPVVLAARTGLGTINHTLLSLEALRARDIPVLGVAFIGDDNADNIRTIAEMGEVKVLGRMPLLERIDAETLNQVFAEHFGGTI
ncbi:dethiobiotin synthase [Magnetovibrio sp.]|uniref:dethiobiotin synthase n=1 Tax=Magnetovibrio sp. TaxID=2024836 RepID=UPI002F954EDC